MQRFRQQGEKVPFPGGVTQVGARVALHDVVKVGKLQRVAKVENGRIVAHQIPVAFFGIKLDRETANIALGVSGAAFSGDG